jgi:uncharacterized protein
MRQSSDEQILDVWVQPKAARNEICGYREGYLRLRVTAPPAEGKANLLCRQMLAKALGIPPADVEIVSGHKSRRKRIRLLGVESHRLQALGSDRGGD